VEPVVAGADIVAVGSGSEDGPVPGEGGVGHGVGAGVVALDGGESESPVSVGAGAESGSETGSVGADVVVGGDGVGVEDAVPDVIDARGREGVVRNGEVGTDAGASGVGLDVSSELLEDVGEDPFGFRGMTLCIEHLANEVRH
jgi:hypothetical protein